jgi:ABC-type transporter Mla subunit MlaD
VNLKVEKALETLSIEWRVFLDDAQDTLNEMEHVLSSVVEGLDELKDMVDDRRDNLDETKDTDI